MNINETFWLGQHLQNGMTPSVSVEGNGLLRLVLNYEAEGRRGRGTRLVRTDATGKQVFDAWNQLAWDTVIGPTFLGRTNALHSESEVTE